MASIMIRYGSRHHQLAAVCEALSSHHHLRWEKLEVDMINKCIWMATSSLFFLVTSSVEFMNIQG